MKNLIEIINDLPGQGDQPGPIFAKQRLSEAVEYFDGMGNIPVKLYLSAYRDPLHVDLIKENLKTHDWKTMGRKLKERFPQLNIKPLTRVGEKIFGEEKQYCMLTSNLLEPNFIPVKDIVKNPDFDKIIKFFNYSVSKVTGNTIKLEPVYPESTENFVDRVCFGKVYHITSESNVEKVEKLGLRCKTGKGDERYREFPERIYVLGFDVKKYNKQKIIDLCKEIADEYLDIAEPAIFECIISGRYFYEDTVMPLQQESVKAMFCYVNIPPEKIKRIY